MSFIVVAYYTTDRIYSECARNFIQSLQKYNLPYQITPIENKGDWYKNTQFKPTFLREKLAQLKATSLVYVDIDAEFRAYPELFNQLDASPHTVIGAHYLDHTKYGRQRTRPELLSGTLFLKNSEKTFNLLDTWIHECEKDSRIWDQRALEIALEKCKVVCYDLPETYCTIFDYMGSVKNPVILQYQASRQVRNNESARTAEITNIPKEGESEPIIPKFVPRVPPQSKPRKIGKGGLVRYHRKWRP